MKTIHSLVITIGQDQQASLSPPFAREDKMMMKMK
ncbi:hypothetical protein SLEP1_g50436 [Rubroshorea leprosula]|uniref:Uncharacterized protein n=1 Tax=Rubroshorea leprosula TaxID=152421 RepID=A0AAV5LZZ0_9ROSI|nr:hypothetical protein SLEP1_g50436 [Rubroshorea leprosula]